MTTLIETEDYDVIGKVPELPELEYTEESDVFDDLYVISDVHIDLVGGSGETRSIMMDTFEDPTNGDTIDVEVDVFTEVYFGYRVSAVEDEPTYLGIMFETTVPVG